MYDLINRYGLFGREEYILEVHNLEKLKQTPDNFSIPKPSTHDFKLSGFYFSLCCVCYSIYNIWKNVQSVLFAASVENTG